MLTESAAAPLRLFADTCRFHSPRAQRRAILLHSRVKVPTHSQVVSIYVLTWRLTWHSNCFLLKLAMPLQLTALSLKHRPELKPSGQIQDGRNCENAQAHKPSLQNHHQRDVVPTHQRPNSLSIQLNTRHQRTAQISVCLCNYCFEGSLRTCSEALLF